MTPKTPNSRQQIGRYELVTRLAVGGMAELFLAKERQIAGLERIVVVKRILPHLADQQSFVDMFLREARIAARLAHPNIIQIYELGEENNSYYMAMEYIHGSTVREIQILANEAKDPLPLGVAIGIINQAAKGLHAAHELRDLDGKSIGLVHRDISPHNLMVTAGGNVKLLDFGVAKATEGMESTYSGNLKGKFSYMSPEQCRRASLDRRSDVFALGICFWELCTGQRLFKRNNELEIMQAITSGDIPRPSDIGQSMPIEVEDVIMKALTVDRERRYQTAEEMRKAVNAAARANNIDYGPDQIADFASRVAGAELSLRDFTLKNALERSLTSKERIGLLHRTGSHTVDGPEAPKSLREALSDGTVKGEAAKDDRSSRPSIRELVSGNGPGGPDQSDTEISSMDAENILKRELEAFGEIDENKVTQIDPRRIKHTPINRGAHPANLNPGTASIPDKAPPSSQRPAPIVIAMVGLAALSVILFVAVFVRSLGTKPPTPLVDNTVLLGDPIPLGWAPTVEKELLRHEVAPLQMYFEGKLGRPVPMVITDSYDDLAEQLLTGKVAFAVMPPLLYVKAKKKDPKIRPLSYKSFDGGLASDGLLLVRIDSGIKKVVDLKGKTFCFTNVSSTSGYLLPRAFIRGEGYDPDTFIGEVHWSGEHTQALKDLLDGKCDAAATYSGGFISAGHLGLQTGKLRQLRITGHIPQDVVVAGPNLSKSEIAGFHKALSEFNATKDLGVQWLGDTQRIVSFEPADDSAFNDLRKIVDEEFEADSHLP